MPRGGCASRVRYGWRRGLLGTFYEVEERILALQEHKRALAGAALDGAEQAGALTRQELLALLT